MDYFLYLILVNYFLDPIVSNLISAGTGMLINFLLQKRYIFQLERKVGHAFLISLATSVLGIGLSTLFIYLLIQIPFFMEYQFITKGIVTGSIFFYNFYMKRFAFERKFF